MSQNSLCATSPRAEVHPAVHATVPALFTKQAELTPNAVAVQFGGVQASFAEIESRSNRMAQYLRSLGMARGKNAGICLKRTPEFIISALAVLKSGGAYVPLDPSYPPERLAFMVQDCKPQVIITRGCMVSPWSARSEQVVDFDAMDRVARLGDEPNEAANRDDIAYVIYTSGSTGVPKGVEITHANLSNLVQWHRTAFTITSADRTTQVASIGFDAAVWEIWPNLCAGAALYIPDEETRNSAVLLRDWLIEHAITVTFIPTPVAEQLLDLDWPSRSSLRFLLTGGDALRHHPRPGLPFALVNNYGPTECTVVATSGIISPDEHAEAPPDIGHAISNTRALVMDENMCLVETGASGELCVGGAGVGRGYVNQPVLTAERFVPDPTAPGARLYRTGDLVRRLPDGRIAFLGRIDEQIKVRGFRIEPNEVVTALNSHPAIRESVVVASEDVSGEKRLVAYVVAKGRMELSDADLRRHLKITMPDFMVPSLFVSLEALPLSANQKVDRSALPTPTANNIIRDEAFSTPRNLIEQQLSAVVSELLNIENVGADDNFFLLGGHSLLGAQLIAKIRDTFDVELSLRKLFESPTISGLSTEIEGLLTTRLAVIGPDELESLSPTK